MKKLIVLLGLIITLMVIPQFAEARGHSNRIHILVNKVKYHKRNHQNHIFQSFLQSSPKHKGNYSCSFAPKGQRLF